MILNQNNLKNLWNPVITAVAFLLALTSFMGVFLVVTPVVSAAPTVSIMEPMDGYTIYGDRLLLELSVGDFTLNASAMGGANVPGEGHWHLSINGNPQGMYAVEMIELTNLPEGDHTFAVELVNNDHTSLNPAVTDSIDITIAYPEITMTYPPDGSVVYGGSSSFSVEVDNLTLSSDIGGSNVNGEGHWQLMLNYGPTGNYSDEEIMVDDIPDGMTIVIVELRNNDQTPTSPRASDNIIVWFEESVPEIMLNDLPENPVSYDGSYTINVSVMNFTLIDVYEPPNMGGMGHYHVYVDDVLIGPYHTTEAMFSGISPGDHTVRVELANRDHSMLIPRVYTEFDLKVMPGMPMIDIVKPMDGTIFYQDHLDLEVMVDNFTLNESAVGGDPVEGEGHYHIYINDDLVGPYTDTMPTLTGLPAGDHVLKVELVNNDHTPLMTPIMDAVNFTIIDQIPSIGILSPMDGGIVYGEKLHMKLGVGNFMLNESAYGMENVPWEGHYHLYVNDDLVGPSGELEPVLMDLPPGDHMIKVELMNNDHSTLIPRIMDMIEVTVVEEIPVIMISEPMDMVQIYDDSFEMMVEVYNFTLNSSMIGETNIPGEGHYHIYINDELVGPFTNLSVMLEDLPTGDHELMVELRNNDHSMLYGHTASFSDMIRFRILDQRPSIKIIDPVDGAIFYKNSIDIAVEVMNFTLNASAIGGEMAAGEGHYHIYINDDLVGPYTNLSVMLEDLPAGMHELKVMLVNNDHKPIMPYAVDMIHFTIMNTIPSISIAKPVDGSMFYGGDLHIEVMIEGFIMNATGIGGENVPGEGHWHLYINGNLIGPYTANMVDLTDLPAGKHNLKVELVNNDHTPIMPAVYDMAEFTLMAMPSISIVSPENGTILEGNTMDLWVNVQNFVLNDSIGGSNKLGEGHYHVYIDGVLIGPFIEETITLTDLSPGEHVLMVDLRNNDHSELDIDASDMMYFTVPESAADITLTFGPVLEDGDPVEGAMVKIMLDGMSYSAETDSTGMATFTVPVDWKGKEIEFSIEKDGYETLSGSASVGEDGMITADTELDMKGEDEKFDWTILIILILISVIAMVVLVVLLRPKSPKGDEE
ncbi:MAG: hypothetical protein ACMUIG_07775 [Thermoplasmatota archaeon]